MSKTQLLQLFRASPPRQVRRNLSVRDPTAQIKEIRSLARQRLIELWSGLFGKAPAPGIRREIMIPLLAYKIQENAYGSLKPSTRAELRRIAKTLERRGKSNGLSMPQRLKPGVLLSRHWHGQVHEIVVSGMGYEYRGKTYRSLSEIARTITGTRWSGPAFFGLKRKPIEREQ